MAKMNSGIASGVDFGDILEALINGYRYYERLTGKKLGRFLPGYRFDAMLLDYEAITPMKQENAFGHVFFGVFDALDITDLWVGGKQLIHERALVNHIPVEAGRVENIWTRIGGDHVD
jgi:cytosine/adenosine deaminase-related metal-dependent hydrolase